MFWALLITFLLMQRKKMDFTLRIYRKLLCALQQKGYHPQQIAKQLKMHPYRVKLITEQPKRPSNERLMQALYKLAEIDLQLKSVSGNRERYLELFLLKPL